MKTNVLEEIVAERARQISKGFDAMHDDAESMDLPTLAIGVALDVDADLMANDEETEDRIAHIRLKHPDRRRRMVIAAALFVAEIERLDRIASQDIESTTDPDSEQQDGETYQIANVEGFDPITQTWKSIGSVGKEKE